jgi:transcriptional regulator with XRE-family HTH domain
MTLEDRLAAARAAKKLSMAAVAKLCGLKSWQAVQQWEKGRAKPSRDNLDKLAEIYGKPIEFFLHGTLPARAKPPLLGPSPIAIQLGLAFDTLRPPAQQLILQMMVQLEPKAADLLSSVAKHPQNIPV